MSRYAEFDEYLGKEYSVDYWSDDASSYAREMVADFTPADWDALEVEWREKPSQWQVYAAQVLPWGEHRRAVPVLLQMVETPDDEVVEAAADSLRETDLSVVEPAVLAQAEQRLRQLASARPGITARIIEQLLRQIQQRASGT